MSTVNECSGLIYHLYTTPQPKRRRPQEYEKKQVHFSMAMENMELVHECYNNEIRQRHRGIIYSIAEVKTSNIIE